MKDIDGGETPLHRAAFGHYKEVAELLIANGADVNAMDDDGWDCHARQTAAVFEGHIPNAGDATGDIVMPFFSSWKLNQYGFVFVE